MENKIKMQVKTKIDKFSNECENKKPDKMKMKILQNRSENEI